MLFVFTFHSFHVFHSQCYFHFIVASNMPQAKFAILWDMLTEVIKLLSALMLRDVTFVLFLMQFILHMGYKL